MKLNKSEIKVLSRKLCNEINAQRQAVYDAAKASYKPSSTTRVLLKYVDKIRELSGKLLPITGFEICTEYTVRHAKEALQNKDMKIDNTYILSYQIEDDITLAQIECDDLNTLIDNIKSIYIK